MASTYITFLKVIKHHNISHLWKLNGQYHYLEHRNGSRIDLLDVKFNPSDPLFERFGSTEYTVGWLEEAGEIEFLAFDVLKSRVNRHLNKDYGIDAKTLITCNPKKNWLYQTVYKPWKEGTLPPEYAFIQSLYNDNPHTADSYGEDLAGIKDKANKQRLMYGNWEYDDDPTTMMNYEAIIDLFTNTVDKSEEKFLTVDAARYGGDKIVYTRWLGLQAYKITYKQKQGTDKTEEDIKDIARDEQIPFSHILVDEDGIGGGIVDHLQGIKGFIANRRPFDVWDTKEQKLIPGNYENLKAQCTYLLADKVNKHEMSVICEDVKIRQELVEELEQIKTKDADKDGPLRLLPKDEIKEVIGRSPDFADTLMMRMYFELSKPPKEHKPYTQPEAEPSSLYGG